jgi:hypothetical protein
MTGFPLTAISCPSMRLCVAVDGFGDALTTADPAGGAHAWRATTVTDAPQGLVDVSCSSAGLCVTVGHTDAYATTDPNAHRWTAAGIDADEVSELWAVTCPSTTLCLAAANPTAVGSPAEILYTTDPASSTARWAVAFTDHDVSVNGIRAIACPSTALCVAVDSDGNVLTSTDPVRGPGTWSSSAVAPGPGLDSVSCASPVFCMAAGPGVFVSTDPVGGSAAWTAGGAPDYFFQVDCASPQLCVGVSDAGTFATNNPAGGPGDWNLVVYPQYSDDGKFTEPTILSVFCSSAQLCLGVGDNSVFSSTTPAIANSWTSVSTTPPGAGLDAVTCPIAQYCVATGSAGSVWTTTNATEGGWTRTLIDPHSELYGISCPSVQFCVAVDASGDAIIGRPGPTPSQQERPSDRARSVR